MASHRIALDHMIGWQGAYNVCCFRLAIMNLCAQLVEHDHIATSVYQCKATL